MAVYRRVYDSRHLQAAKNRDQLRKHALGNRVWVTFTLVTPPTKLLFLLLFRIMVLLTLSAYNSTTFIRRPKVTIEQH